MNRSFGADHGQRGLSSFLAAAARRYLSVLIFSELPVALAVFLGAVILVVLIGTNAVRGSWLTLPALASLCYVAIRVRRRSLDRYRLAQVLDRRLALNDSLSTAWYLTGRPDQDALMTSQLKAAEELARSVTAETAFPLEWSTAWLAPAALVGILLALLIWRFERSERMDLRSSLLPVPLQEVLNPRRSTANEVHKNSPGTRDRNAAHPERVDLPDSLVARANESKTDTKSFASAKTAGDGAASQGESSPEKRLEDLQRQQQMTTDQQKNSSHSLLNRMQDALSGVVSQLQQAAKPNEPQQSKSKEEGQSSPEDKKSSQSAEENAKAPSQQSSSSQSQAGDGKNQANATQPSAVEKEKSSAQAGNAKQPSTAAGDDAQSGAGRNDGAKDVRSAEQLKALGKLEEIVGKRSASVSGDMTVERSSAKQQLKTEYSNRIESHSDLGGEVNRDEIPPEYRSYVRAYMDAMRKQEQSAPK